MKKYIVIVIIAIGGVSISCSADDNEVLSTSKIIKEVQEFDYTVNQKDGDSISEGDTGGQGGSTPIKP